jgi:hypothetical protein
MKVMSITVSHCRSCASLNGASLYYNDTETNIEIHKTLSYEEGMTELRKLEQKLNKVAEMYINQYDSEISYKTLAGVIH